jgi:hypothetical protein
MQFLFSIVCFAKGFQILCYWNYIVNAMKMFRPRLSWMRKGRRMIVMSSTSQGSKSFDCGQQLSFDSYHHCSRAISNYHSHCTTFRDININVDGISRWGKATAAGKGTIQWFIEDAEGAVHEFQIPNSFYVPSSPKITKVTKVITSFTIWY